MSRHALPTAAGALLGRSMFSSVERETTCACGRSFTQMQVSVPELEALERMGRIDSFLAAVPDGFVPVHCPPCETKDLGRQARIDEGRARSSETGAYSRTLPDRRAVHHG